MSNITIKKAKIKDSLFLEVEYSEQQEDGVNSVKKDCTAPVHDDLKLAFKKLNIHLALLCHQVNTATGKGAINILKAFEEEVTHQLDPEQEYTFTAAGWEIVKAHYCSGFTIGGSGDNEGVVLVGKRELSNGKTLNLVSPFHKWEEDAYPYAYISELGQIIEECKHEVHAYLFEGKHQPDAQLSLFEGDEEEA